MSAQQHAELGRQLDESMLLPLVQQQTIANIVYGSRYGSSPDLG
ncbi:hypothetical protein C4K38_3881 [Pseudomonas chlororaphis subsp. piscium]|nr:hypothetical protein C4K38_3881 [Pseudomonas chlororaphis subsp. piscium]